jgi:predicted outer membrane protein
MRWNTEKLYKVGAIAVATLMLASVAIAQERPRVRPQEPGANPAQQNLQNLKQRITANRPTQGANNDRMIADCLAISNQEEIALGNLAAAKSQNPQVKQFAETLVKDHNQFLAQLEKHGAQRVAFSLDREGRRADAAAPAKPREPGAADQSNTAEQRTAFTQDGNLDFINLKRQMAEKCIENAHQGWSEKKGNEADMCFVGSQAVQHQQMINALEVLRPYASAELQPVIDQGISATKTHLAHAEKLAKELGQQASAQPAGQAAPEERRND